MAVGQFIKDFYFTGSVTADLTGLASQPPRRRPQRGLIFVSCNGQTCSEQLSGLCEVLLCGSERRPVPFPQLLSTTQLTGKEKKWSFAGRVFFSFSKTHLFSSFTEADMDHEIQTLCQQKKSPPHPVLKAKTSGRKTTEQMKKESTR